MKKVILVNSPIYDRKIADKEDYLPPLGLGYIATEMENNNIEVSILDAVFHNYTVKEINDILTKEKPDFIGINIFSVNFDLVKQIIEGYIGCAGIIVGGRAVEHLYEDIFSFKTLNKIYCIIGEGEYIDTAIVMDKLDEKPIDSKNENRFAYLVSKESIYFPKDISALKLNRHFFERREIINPYGYVEESIVTSRECIYNCAFCGAARSHNIATYSRCRTVDDIKSELVDIKQNNPSVKSIRILDDLFLRNKTSIENAVKIFSCFDFEWRAMCHVKSLITNLDMLDELKKSKCKELEIGVESGNDLIRKFIHKEGTIDEVKKVITSVLQQGINVKAYFILGFPTETYDQCLDTYKFAKEILDISKSTSGKFRISAFQFRPYHGTELFEMVSKKEFKYTINDNLGENRKQFNFTAGNFSECSQIEIDKLINKMNNLSLDKESKIDENTGNKEM